MEELVFEGDCEIYADLFGAVCVHPSLPSQNIISATGRV